jgi:hypothetical protein
VIRSIFKYICPLLTTARPANAPTQAAQKCDPWYCYFSLLPRRSLKISLSANNETIFVSMFSETHLHVFFPPREANRFSHSFTSDMDSSLYKLTKTILTLINDTSLTYFLAAVGLQTGTYVIPSRTIVGSPFSPAAVMDRILSSIEDAAGSQH